MRVDNSPPVIDDPAWAATPSLLRGSAYSYSPTITDHSYQVRLELLIDGRVVETSRPNAPTTSGGPPTTAATASWYRWNVYDRAGNLATFERHITVDTQKPTVRVVKAPRHGARVTGRVTVTLEPSDDSRVRRVEVLVNGRVVARSSAWPYRMRVDTRKQKRVMKVRFRVYDRAGNVRTTASRTWYRR